MYENIETQLGLWNLKLWWKFTFEKIKILENEECYYYLSVWWICAFFLFMLFFLIRQNLHVIDTKDFQTI